MWKKCEKLFPFSSRFIHVINITIDQSQCSLMQIFDWRSVNTACLGTDGTIPGPQNGPRFSLKWTIVFYILANRQKKRYFQLWLMCDPTYISTRSTFIPQGSVAPSNVSCILCAISSLAISISCKLCVPAKYNHLYRNYSKLVVGIHVSLEQVWSLLHPFSVATFFYACSVTSQRIMTPNTCKMNQTQSNNQICHL